MASCPENTSLSRAQVRAVDRRAIEEYGIAGMVLMENAGRNAADLIRRHMHEVGRVAIVCGRGNNGGDGFVIARHLANGGSAVEVYLACDPDRLMGDAKANFEIVRRMSIPCHAFDNAERIDHLAEQLQSADVIVDAVLGTGFSGDVRPPLDCVIRAINAAGQSKVVAIDLPSGLDCDSGRPCNATVKAGLTITFVAQKIGFLEQGAGAFTGKVHVADIGAPVKLIRQVLGAQIGD